MLRGSRRGATPESFLVLLAGGGRRFNSIKMTRGPMIGADLFPFWFDLGTDRLGKWAPRMQAAPLRNISRGRDIVLQHDGLPLEVGMVGQRGTEQGLRVRM